MTEVYYDNARRKFNVTIPEILVAFDRPSILRDVRNEVVSRLADEGLRVLRRRRPTLPTRRQHPYLPPNKLRKYLSR